MPSEIPTRGQHRIRAAVVVLMLLVVTTTAAAGMVATRHPAARTPATAPPAGARSATNRNPAAPPGAAPTTGAAPGTVPVGALTWTSVAGAAVPVSPTAGPFDTRFGLARGFAHTPLGAVLAAAHLTVRLCPQVGPAVFEATARDQVVGADATALRNQLEQDYQVARARLGVGYGAPAGQLYATARGFRVASYSPGSALVLLLIEGPGPSGSVLISLAVTLRWVDGDWALLAPAGGSFDTAATLTTDPTGFTMFLAGG